MTDLPPCELLHRLFEQHAKEHPERTALRCDGVVVSYGDLEKQASTLARALLSRKIGRGRAVAILLHRGIEMYAAILGVLKSGAAYVPLDPEYPPDRIAFILDDCKAATLLTAPQLRASAGEFAGPILEVAKVAETFMTEHHAVGATAEPEVSGTDLCYIIYTSGSTGRPKGVEIEHRSVCHFARAEQELFALKPDDRVYQGFSIAFDASVEEIWLAFAAGASLVVGTDEMRRSGPELAARLRAAEVSVLSVIPSMLTIMEEDIPTVRLLIFGGEVCPAALARKWLRPNRRVFNTYGPTEATVVATAIEVFDGGRVTIGKPIGACTACLLDEQLRQVPEGEAGELCLGGPGLARGYAGRPDLTAEKFIHNPIDRLALVAPRLYRTGDLARWNKDGELEFLGRIDTQVKIRGFRVELSEIESVLLESHEIRVAVVMLREDVPGLRQLVAYIVARDGTMPDEEMLRSRLRERLPQYMVPAVFEVLAGLPTLASGKVDRKALAPPQRKSAGAIPSAAAGTRLERQLTAAWSNLFNSQQVSVSEDFFLDLGGHSLLAARMVSELRRTPEFADLSVADVYRSRTIAALASEWERRGDSARAAVDSTAKPGYRQKPDGRASPGPRSIPAGQHFLCGTAQLISLLFVLTFFALQWLTPYLTYTILIEEEYETWQAILGAVTSLFVLYPVMLCVPIAMKWLLIGRYRPGAYPLWGTYFFRWWLVTTVEAAVPVGYLEGTPLLNIYARLMGARIGEGVYLGASHFAIYDLLSIGADSSVNADASLLGYTVEDGWLKIGSISIGKRCFVGTRACLCQDTMLGDDSALEDLSMLPAGKSIPAGQGWNGSPAFASDSQPAAPTGPRLAGFARRFCFGVLHAAGLLIFPVLVSGALFPGIVFMNMQNYDDPYYGYLLLAPVVGLSFVVLLCLEIVLVKWLVVGRIREGQYPLHSFFYLRKWFFDQTMALSLDVLGPIYASVYLRPWYRALGAKIGGGAEISTASFASPDLLHVGEDSFVADAVSLGAPRVRNGIMTLGPLQVGRRSFIGNSAVLPPGTDIGEDVLIGCLSKAPDDPRDALKRDSTWMGSPSVFLPQRQKSPEFPDRLTFNPPFRMRVMRAAIEFVRMIAPSTGFIALISVLFSVMLLLRDSFSLLETLALFPILYAGSALTAAFVTIGLKWALVWRYRAGERPLWSTFVWRNELLNAMHEHFAGPFLVDALTGTPFICWYFRLLGARIGRRVYLESSDMSEFDLATIGDEVALNSDATIQTHLFEDRVMKVSSIKLGRGSSVGTGSLVLYDSEIGDGANLGSCSLLLKGESLPDGTRWEGIPARRA